MENTTNKTSRAKRPATNREDVDILGERECRKCIVTQLKAMIREFSPTYLRHASNGVATIDFYRHAQTAVEENLTRWLYHKTRLELREETGK